MIMRRLFGPLPSNTYILSPETKIQYDSIASFWKKPKQERQITTCTICSWETKVVALASSWYSTSCIAAPIWIALQRCPESAAKAQRKYGTPKKPVRSERLQHPLMGDWKYKLEITFDWQVPTVLHQSIQLWHFPCFQSSSRLVFQFRVYSGDFFSTSLGNERGPMMKTPFGVDMIFFQVLPSLHWKPPGPWIFHIIRFTTEVHWCTDFNLKIHIYRYQHRPQIAWKGKISSIFRNLGNKFFFAEDQSCTPASVTPSASYLGKKLGPQVYTALQGVLLLCETNVGTVTCDRQAPFLPFLTLDTELRKFKITVWTVFVKCINMHQ